MLMINNREDFENIIKNILENSKKAVSNNFIIKNPGQIKMYDCICGVIQYHTLNFKVFKGIVNRISIPENAPISVHNPLIFNLNNGQLEFLSHSIEIELKNIVFSEKFIETINDAISKLKIKLEHFNYEKQ